MSNGMKFVRFLFLVALAACIGISIAECRRGGIDLNNSPQVCTKADNLDCPLRTHNPN